jgi:transcriptional regulator with XRE-family HTH domain
VKLHSFGACLAQLLTDKQQSVRALAQALNVERSLVYKWRRGDRTPQLASTYMTRIATILSLTPDELATLEAAQRWSLSAPRPPRRPQQPQPRNVQQLLDVNLEPLTLDPDPLGAPNETTKGENLLPDQRNVRGTRVIQGRIAAFQATLEMIDAAPAPADPSDPSASTIFTTSLEGNGWSEIDRSEYSERWHTVIRRAISRGWQFRHLVRLDKNAQRSLTMARAMLDLMGTGRYAALYSYASESTLPVAELVVIPGVAAVQFFATHTWGAVDTALVLKQREEIALAQAYVQQALVKAKPLLRAFPPNDWVEFAASRVEAEEQYGGHCLVKDGLSQLSEPPEWSHTDAHWVLHSRHRGDSLAALIDACQRQIAAFEAQVARHRYRDICPMRAVIRLVQQGHYLQGSDIDSFVEPIADRVAHLERVIALLRAHDHYELALVDEGQEEEIPILANRYWEVTGGMRVFTNVHVRSSQGRTLHTGIVIAEPSLVGAFQNYFDDLWERISHRDKDKGFVIWWLERQLESLR